MRVKTTVTYRYTPLRMAKIEMNDKHQRLATMWRKWIFHTLLAGMENGKQFGSS